MAKLQWLMKWQTIVTMVVGVLTVLGMSWGVFVTMDKRYQQVAYAQQIHEAQNEKVGMISKRLSVHVVGDVINQVDKQIWQLEDRNKCHTVSACLSMMDPETKERYRKLLKDRELKQKEFDKVSK